MYRIIAVFLLVVSSLIIAETISMDEKLKKLDEEEQAQKKRDEYVGSLYNLEPNETLRDITNEVLASPFTAEAQKQAIRSTGRHIYVFEYPSDSYKIKGYISLIPGTQHHPLLINLRGGNRSFAIPNPGADLACARDYAVLATTYRGGISEGTDEYGGADVADVKHLIDYIPTLEKQLDTELHADKLYMMGGSRGGFQMFLALSRYPEIQQRVLKAVSLSGALDTKNWVKERPDNIQMFKDDFGYTGDEQWLQYRNPIQHVDKIRNDLPFFIIQASEDIRVDLAQGHAMVQKLEAQGNPVTYLEVEGAQHCLSDRDDRVDIILNWLEQ